MGVLRTGVRNSFFEKVTLNIKPEGGAHPEHFPKAFLN